MIHKGLVYLEAVKQGRIVLNNAESPVMTLGNSPKAIVTMFYANDPLVLFHAVLYNVLRTQHILRTSNLNENIDSLHLWSEVTPDVSSEKTALVAQTSVLPRTLDTKKSRQLLSNACHCLQETTSLAS